MSCVPSPRRGRGQPRWAEVQDKEIGGEGQEVGGGRRRRAPVAPALNVPYVLAAALVQYPLMILLPLFLGWWIRRRYRVGWGIFLAGAGTFIFSQVVHLPLNWALGLVGGGRGVALWPLVPLALAAGLSAGVCEEGRPLACLDPLPEARPELARGLAVRRRARRR